MAQATLAQALPLISTRGPLERAVLRRAGWEAADDCSGVVQMYCSHFPCISCIAVISQFVRLFPSIRLEMDFDSMWRTRFEPASQADTERFHAHGGLSGRRARIAEGFYEW